MMQLRLKYFSQSRNRDHCYLIAFRIQGDLRNNSKENYIRSVVYFCNCISSLPIVTEISINAK